MHIKLKDQWKKIEAKKHSTTFNSVTIAKDIPFSFYIKRLHFSKQSIAQICKMAYHVNSNPLTQLTVKLEQLRTTKGGMAIQEITRNT